MYVASVASFSGVNLLDVVCGSSCANRDIDVETASYLKFHETKRSYQRKIETKHETAKESVLSLALVVWPDIRLFPTYIFYWWKRGTGRWS